MKGIKKNILTLSLTGAALFAHANKEISFPAEKGKIVQSVQKNFPETILKFTTLDFDERMALKERICQQEKTEDFSPIIADTLRKKDPTSFTLENYKKCWEIVLMGRPLSEINPQKNSVIDIADLCGFKKLHAFLQFYTQKENQGKRFLEDKDKEYISAFITEEQIFNDILELYDFETRIKTWQQFNFQINPYLNKEKDSSLKDLYWKNLKKRVRKELVQQKKMPPKTR